MIIGRLAALGRIELRKCLSLLVAGLIGVIGPSVLASTSQSAKVTQIVYQAGGRVFINQAGARTQAPACASLTRWVIDSSTMAGQALVAGITSAYLANKNVYIVGTGACALWGDSESVDYFALEG